MVRLINSLRIKQRIVKLVALPSFIPQNAANASSCLLLCICFLLHAFCSLLCVRDRERKREKERERERKRERERERERARESKREQERERERE